MNPNPLIKSRLAQAAMILATVSILGLDSPVQGAELKPETLLAWDRYVRLTEDRIGSELASEKGFFIHEFGRPSEANVTWQSVHSGQVMVSRMETEDPRGRAIKVPGGMIHHWRGTILIPSVRLEQVIHRLRYPDPRVPPQKDVLETRILDRDQDSLRIYLKLVRKKIVTVAYNTEHLVRYRWHDPFRASSRSMATRIAELEKLHTPQEREKIPGLDRGFLWRLRFLLEIPAGRWRRRGGVRITVLEPRLSRHLQTDRSPHREIDRQKVHEADAGLTPASPSHFQYGQGKPAAGSGILTPRNPGSGNQRQPAVAGVPVVGKSREHRDRPCARRTRRDEGAYRRL